MINYSNYATSKNWIKNDDIINTILLLPMESISSRSTIIIPVKKDYSAQFPQKIGIDTKANIEIKEQE